MKRTSAIAISLMVALALPPDARAEESFTSSKFYVGGGYGVVDPVCGRTVGIGGACFNVDQSARIDIWVNDVNARDKVQSHVRFYDVQGRLVGSWTICDRGAGNVPVDAAVMKISVGSLQDLPAFMHCREPARGGAIDVTYHTF